MALQQLFSTLACWCAGSHPRAFSQNPSSARAARQMQQDGSQPLQVVNRDAAFFTWGQPGCGKGREQVLSSPCWMLERAARGRIVIAGIP